jgi:hypothetical protein
VHARQFAKELLDLRSDVILTNSTPFTVPVGSKEAAIAASPRIVQTRF